jgi:hypothetical protein
MKRNPKSSCQKKREQDKPEDILFEELENIQLFTHKHILLYKDKMGSAIIDQRPEV